MDNKILTTTLKEHLTFKNGKTSPERSSKSNIVVYGSNGDIGFTDLANAPAQTIVIGRVGTYCGSVHFSDAACWVTDNAIVGNVKQKGEELFWYYALKHMDLNQYRSGSGQPLLNQSTLNGIPIVIPKYSEIRKLVGKKLFMLDKKITFNRQINKTLEQMAQALFKSWFVDFDPVVDNALDAGFFEQDLEFSDELLRRAEARKAVRESADFKPLPDDIRQQFPTAFEECSVPSLGLGGWIPSGWPVSTTGDEFTVKGGSTPSTANPEFWEGGDIHWTSPKDLSGSKEKVMLDTERKITDAGLNKITSGLLPTETVLMSSRAPIGYLALTKIPVSINQGYIAIPATKRLSQEYVLYLLNSSIDEIKGISGGTTFAEISKKTFKSISIVIPNTEVVDIFSVTTKSYLNKMTLNVVERSALEQLRDTLLPKLISGELSLSDSGVDTADEILA
ncbi:restriction endonuclease subunit S [Serratia quinivorans]|uniref:restriction endonuclease subunit S n=1 Tax=Serratia quinivorans TaxID=137545 RepID=UPI00217A8EFB|nr:restriction endonuclease subunit S [Serratia quinivorans]CAI0860730.1 EcoKI restriction-modification system protein HsdS [Serratia quinivorans]